MFSMAKYYKLVVFVPLTHLEKVRTAICAAGAGKIGGKYDQCTFSTLGTGTFRPRKGAKPFAGKLNRLEKTKEARLETILPARSSKKIIRALLKSHPYEVPAYDLYPLMNNPLF